jgi:hypothetical protein
VPKPKHSFKVRDKTPLLLLKIILEIICLSKTWCGLWGFIIKHNQNPIFMKTKYDKQGMVKFTSVQIQEHEQYLCHRQYQANLLSSFDDLSLLDFPQL